jgi:hypothetical protein
MDTDRGQQRTAAGATGGSTLGWLRANIGKIIIGAALVTAVTGWLSGFFDSILHDVEAFCSLREAVEYHWPFGAPQATSDRFTILIA